MKRQLNIVVVELLHKIMTAIMDGTYEQDEELKIEILNVIAE